MPNLKTLPADRCSSSSALSCSFCLRRRSSFSFSRSSFFRAWSWKRFTAVELAASGIHNLEHHALQKRISYDKKSTSEKKWSSEKYLQQMVSFRFRPPISWFLGPLEGFLKISKTRSVIFERGEDLRKPAPVAQQSRLFLHGLKLCWRNIFAATAWVGCAADMLKFSKRKQTPLLFVQVGKVCCAMLCLVQQQASSLPLLSLWCQDPVGIKWEAPLLLQLLDCQHIMNLIRCAFSTLRRAFFNVLIPVWLHLCILFDP